jgi:hypothetical protein
VSTQPTGKDPGNAAPPVARAKVLPRQSSFAARDVVRSAARALLAEGFDLRESVNAFKAQVVDVALEQAGRSRKLASARMHVSRELVRRVRARSSEGK